MWQQIINPKSGNKIDIRSKRGKYILNRYIKQLQIGGAKYKNKPMNLKQKIEHKKALKKIQEEELRRQQAYLDNKFRPNETENISELEKKLIKSMRNYNLETEKQLEGRTQGIVKRLIIPGLTEELGEDGANSSEEENQLRFMDNEQLLNNFMGLENDDEIISGPETGTESLGNWEDDETDFEEDLAEINELSNDGEYKSSNFNEDDETDLEGMDFEEDLAEINELSNDGEYKSSNFNEDDETDFEGMDFEDENKEKINMLESMPYDQLRRQLDKIPHLIKISSDDEIQKDIEDIKDMLIYKDYMSAKVEDFLRRSLMLFNTPNPPKIAKK